MFEDEIDVYDLRTQIVNSSNFTLKEKRKILPQLNNLSEDEKELLLQRISEKKVEPKKINKHVSVFFDLFRNLFLIFYSRISQTFFLKHFLLFIFVVWGRMFYSTPGWISVYAFPKDVWKIRQSLSLIKEHLPEYYELVINNTDKIVLTDNRPDGTGGHFSNFFDQRYTYIKYLDQRSLVSLSDLLVHEACHWNQDITNRLMLEPPQKLENECTYLWIYTMEILQNKTDSFNKAEILQWYKLASDPNGRWWDGWKKTWKQWNTARWLMDLLPKEKVKERKMFGEHYDYNLWKILIQVVKKEKSWKISK